MKRILISQNEKNDGTDYVVVNGKLIKDEDIRLKYYREVRKSDNWKVNYKDNFLELKSEDGQILIKSNYLDKDNVNRSIYYTYLITETVNLENVLTSLEKDSQIINRKVDRQKTLEVVEKIKTNRKLKSQFTLILVALAIAGFSYLIINTFKE